ncbi:hypothetical protein [[Mycobacterium] burgundiense]|uniref:Uncharacterized protein n=1 Tax=[Mycobacterium] burgundiense TaxID=3064286 RepID=A0ABN9MUQ9_9MYCO|nr:hypothetical protein [Mycolicibacterium sp. MU0053]CAJ1495509.1 hypothetical protein MU0053_000408 [Mycolicibacterium sp. MU0053]
MTKLTLWIGGLLVATGVIAYIASAAASVTALIPAFVGILLVVAGLIARNPNAHRHAIHAALVIALVGALGSLMNVAKIGDLFAGTAERPAAIIVSAIMLVLLLVYVVAGVRSFIAARRARDAGADAAA